jgi:hypothetical protein
MDVDSIYSRWRKAEELRFYVLIILGGDLDIGKFRLRGVRRLHAHGNLM